MIVEPITLGQLLQAVDGRLLGEPVSPDTPISLVSTDSRNMEPGALFIPLAGESGYSLLMLKPMDVTLEDIFLQLTSEDKGGI